VENVPVSLTAAEDLLARDLIGRDGELGWLRERRREVERRRGAAVLLLGVPGVGKSRLLREFERDSRDGSALVLSGRAVAGGTARPYRPLVEALAGGLRPGVGLGPTQQARLKAALTTLSPPATASGTRVDTVAAAESCIAALAAPGSRPVVLTVDDVHWADQETQSVLGYLGDNVDAHRALVVQASRPPEDDEVGSMLRRLIQRRAVRVCEVGPLPPESIDALVLSCLGADGVAGELLSFIRARAGGNPYAAEELVAGLVRSGALVRSADQWRLVSHRLTTVAPTTVAASVRRRVDELAPTTRRVLDVAAVLGHAFDWRLVVAASNLSEDVVLASLREASYAGLLAGSGEHVAFRHALTRDEVLARMLAPDRRRVAQAALAVVLRSGTELDDEPAELALGLAELAGATRIWRELLVSTGETAARHGAVATAVARLRKAQETGSPAEPDAVSLRALEAQARIHAVTGDVDAAVRCATAALTAHRADSDAGDLPRLHLVLARAALAGDRLDVAREHLGRSTGPKASAGAPSAASAEREVLRAALELAEGDLTAARARAVAAIESGPVDVELRCQAYEVLGRCDRVSDVSAAEAWFSAALAAAEEADHGIWVARALHELGTIDLLDTMRVERLRRARRAAVATGVPAAVVGADFHLAEALVARGEPAAGRAAAERAAAVARRMGSPMLPWALLTIARSFAHERDDAAMEATLAQAHAAAPHDIALTAAAQGRVRLMRALHGADRDAALGHLDVAVDLLKGLPGHHFPHWGLWVLLHAVRDPEQTAENRAFAIEQAGVGTRFNIALLDAATAVDLGRRGSRTQAEHAWAAALARLRGYQRAEWLVHLTAWITADAAAEHRWGQPVAWMQDAVRWFAAHQQPPLATAARRFLLDHGAPVPRRGRGESPVPPTLGTLGVTSREVDVLRLLGVS
jgi:hypothetical protein